MSERFFLDKIEPTDTQPTVDSRLADAADVKRIFPNARVTISIEGGPAYVIEGGKKSDPIPKKIPQVVFEAISSKPSAPKKYTEPKS